MLVLARIEGEAILIGDHITVTILKSGHNVKIGIEAPRSVNVVRKEISRVRDITPDFVSSCGDDRPEIGCVHCGYRLPH